jgi:Rieske 2Fe-2S family protein
VFVSAASDPQPLRRWLDTHTPELAGFADLPIADYRIGSRTETIVAANWKVLVENYAECLHCAIVHPELTTRIPLYRTGHVVDPDRDDGVVDLAPGTTALTDSGTSTNAPLAGIGDRPEYSGAFVLPNVFFDLTPTNLALTAMFPIAPDRTLVVGEYLFDAATVARPDFDPAPEVDFNERIGAQDYTVCEIVQRGVSSRSFVHGGLTEKDRYVAEFETRYLSLRGPIATE